MGNRVFTNNASATLAADITDVQTTLQVEGGKGALYPAPVGSQFFKVALVNAAGDLEICHCTSRTGDVLTILRAQEGTTAQAWTQTVTRVELRVTAGTMEAMLQKDGDTLLGDIDADGNEIKNARLTDDTVMVGGQLVGTALRGTEDDGSNEIVVPDDGSRATAGGSRILTAADNLLVFFPVGTILLWAGTLGNVPSGWQVCDGTNGTPDLRGQFVRGAGGSFAFGATGGATNATGVTSSEGAHTHTASGTSGSTTLTEAQMPEHTHRLYGSETGSVATLLEPLSHGLCGIKGGAGRQFTDESGDGSDLVEPAGGTEGHTHSVSVTTSSNGAHTHNLSTISTVPPFVNIYYIMKVTA